MPVITWGRLSLIIAIYLHEPLQECHAPTCLHRGTIHGSCALLSYDQTQVREQAFTRTLLSQIIDWHCYLCKMGKSDHWHNTDIVSVTSMASLTATLLQILQWVFPPSKYDSNFFSLQTASYPDPPWPLTPDPDPDPIWKIYKVAK